MNPKIAVCLIAVMAASNCLCAAAQTIERLSVDSSGIEGNHISFRPALSADGAVSCFESYASNLVAGDNNGFPDVFVRDIAAGVTVCASVDSAGNQATDSSSRPSISADGRWVAFQSAASNLVVGDTNQVIDIFLRDLTSGQTVRASLDSSGIQANSSSGAPVLSSDGRWVAFHSIASNLAPPDTNGFTDVFARDMLSGLVVRVSVGLGGAQASKISNEPAISGDGHLVAFRSQADNLVVNDTNASQDIFVRDLQSGVTTRVSVSSAGVQANGSSFDAEITPDGRFVVFDSGASNLVPGDTNTRIDVFLRDRSSGTTTLVSLAANGAQGDLESVDPAISADGRLIVFQSYASNLVPGDTNGLPDVFRRDRVLGVTDLLSVGLGGAPANGGSAANSPLFEDGPALSADGWTCAFQSDASNLVLGDNNVSTDIFLRRDPRPPVIYCTAKFNSLGCLPTIQFSGSPSASAGSGFLVSCSDVINNKSGLLFYGLHGQAAIPFQNGTLCVQSPVKRTVGVNSFGNPPPNDCSGVYVLDMNCFAAGGCGGNPDPMLSQPFAVVACQWWGRDPGFPAPNNTTLSDALEYTVGP